MESAATLLHEARAAAGMSRRTLARRAGVPISTVSRVEDGEVDPTITMLQRMISAAGQQVSLGLEPIPKRRSIAALCADTWSPSGVGPKVNWTASPRILGLAALASPRGRGRDRDSAATQRKPGARRPPRQRSPKQSTHADLARPRLVYGDSGAVVALAATRNAADDRRSTPRRAGAVQSAQHLRLVPATCGATMWLTFCSTKSRSAQLVAIATRLKDLDAHAGLLIIVGGSFMALHGLN